ADELSLFIGHFAYAMYRVGLVWLFYIALEPYARRLWPWMLVSWVRLFGGRARDPLVGRDLLVGTVFGVAAAVNVRLAEWLPGRLGLPPARPPVSLWGLEALRGLPQAVTAALAIHTTSAVTTFMPVMLFLVARLLLRRTWPAVVVVSIIGALINVPESGSAVVYAAFIVIVLAMFWTLLLRFGLLATVTCISIIDLLTQVPLTFDLSSWRAGAGVPTLILVLGMTAWAFRVAVAGRPLFRDALLEAEAPASR
ncbi:MAG TPA: hypothetical protein VN898_01815, partial [Candidatus Binatia bacterium]|nr:hypothetical protein [Candidatus Binatia bacterium]